MMKKRTLETCTTNLANVDPMIRRKRFIELPSCRSLRTFPNRLPRPADIVVIDEGSPACDPTLANVLMDF
jgi:hypothetical protein